MSIGAGHLIVPHGLCDSQNWSTLVRFLCIMDFCCRYYVHNICDATATDNLQHTAVSQHNAGADLTQLWTASVFL